MNFDLIGVGTILEELSKHVASVAHGLAQSTHIDGTASLAEHLFTTHMCPSQGMLTPAASCVDLEEPVADISPTMMLVFLLFVHVTFEFNIDEPVASLLWSTIIEMLLASYLVDATAIPCDTTELRAEQPPYTFGELDPYTLSSK